MNPSALHTLLVPTFNRPGMLAVLLEQLGRSDVNVVVLDSSLPANQDRNRRSAARFPQIQYLQFPSDIHSYEKCLAGLRGVRTPYVSFLADDDFLFLAALRKALAVLE